MKPSRIPLTNPAILIGFFVILLSVIGLFILFTSQKKSSMPPPGLGELGAACGGPSILPCMPGLVCSVPPERWATDEGVCVKDTRPQPVTKNDGESCGGENEVCAFGLTCEIASGTTSGMCRPMMPSNHPFILAIIPEGMKLVKGAYTAKTGTTVKVTVRATDVSEGKLYLKPSTASYAGVRPEDQVGDLAPSDVPNEYHGQFTVSDHLGAQLIAVMKDRDGQEVSLGITVAAQ